VLLLKGPCTTTRIIFVAMVAERARHGPGGRLVVLLTPQLARPRDKGQANRGGRIKGLAKGIGDGSLNCRKVLAR
jgi:hypothetical protein